MSRKSDLANDMKKFTGRGFIDRNQLAEYMGYSDPHSIDQYLFGLKRNGRKYFIWDVAENICDMAE